MVCISFGIKISSINWRLLYDTDYKGADRGLNHCLSQLLPKPFGMLDIAILVCILSAFIQRTTSHVWCLKQCRYLSESNNYNY